MLTCGFCGIELESLTVFYCEECQEFFCDECNVNDALDFYCKDCGEMLIEVELNKEEDE